MDILYELYGLYNCFTQCQLSWIIDATLTTIYNVSMLMNIDKRFHQIKMHTFPYYTKSITVCVLQNMQTLCISHQLLSAIVKCNSAEIDRPYDAWDVSAGRYIMHQRQHNTCISECMFCEWMCTIKVRL